jgi:hypothetical protein
MCRKAPSLQANFTVAAVAYQFMVVGDDHYGFSLVGFGSEHFCDGAHISAVKAVGGFIENQDFPA